MICVLNKQPTRRTAAAKVLCWFLVVFAYAAALSNSALAEPRKRSNLDPGKNWALKPLVRPPVPQVQGKSNQVLSPVDAFVLQRLLDEGLAPSPSAARGTLIRRVYFDLLGLPPTAEEARAFAADAGADAYERLVERALASPHYGERWAQHWLDLVRFAETHGFEMNQPRPNAWRYRDYVIQAFNANIPYDRFVAEQLAGDALEQDAATGFLVAGPWDQVKSPDPVLTANQRADEMHDIVSTTASTFLGLTVGCARCHDHKFDPIPQKDYFAFKAALADVQHGDRPLKVPNPDEHERELSRLQHELAEVDQHLASFEPAVFSGRILWLDEQSADANAFGSRIAELKRPSLVGRYAPGSARGELQDPGSQTRSPNWSPDYLCWSNTAGQAVFACEPRVQGRFQVWISWAAGLTNHAPDARYLIDFDGDPSTTADQQEIAKVDQCHFADGPCEATGRPLWSGFYDAGIRDFTTASSILLFGGANNNAQVTADLLLLVEKDNVKRGANLDKYSDPIQFLRTAVNPRRNEERFEPVQAKRLRFTILRTTDAEPCLDELEVYSTDGTNVALATGGTTSRASSVFPNSEIHRLEHLNDGQVGNSRSWISNERGRGWVELEFPEKSMIHRVAWGRDRQGAYTDRLAVDYRIEVATTDGDWQVIAGSGDRQPYLPGRAPAKDLGLGRLSAADAKSVSEARQKRTVLRSRIDELSAAPMVYAGVMSDQPQLVRRFHRGDPMQEREEVQPATLSALPLQYDTNAVFPGLPDGRKVTPGQTRRLALAKWITDKRNPLAARVMANRIWQYHFGEGLVSTPGDLGANGAKPTHPELLDWLAAELIEPQLRLPGETTPLPWSMKHLHRIVLHSLTYRQASASRPECAKVDAGTRLLWRFPPRRLDAEALRDSILALSGVLELKMGGPGFSAFEPNDNYVRVYEPRKEFGPAEWRRMIYMTKARMQQDGTFGAFDCPDGGQVVAKRGRSITPLQALNLLNSGFMLQQSRLFAERLEREAAEPPSQVRRAFELAFGREPLADELAASEEVIRQHGIATFCRAIFNSNEFLFIE
jgi:hypothetical protein